MQEITLISDAEAASARCGFDVIGRLLFTQIRLDAQPFITPMILRDGDTERVVVRQQETGNMMSSGANLDDLLFYEPWVSIDRRVLDGIPVSPTLVDALAPIVGDRVLHLNEGVVRAHYDALGQRLSVEVKAADLKPVRVCEIRESDVLEWFAAARDESKPAATKLVSEVAHLRSLSKHVGSPADTRFIALRELLASSGEDALLVSSPPNYSELSAMSHRPGSWVLFVPASDTLYQLNEITGDVDAHDSQTYSSLPAAVRELVAGRRLAIEEQYLSAALALELENAGFSLGYLSLALGNWRDTRDREDLAAQLIAARATTEAIEEALEVARQRIECGESFTENDIYLEFLNQLSIFQKKHELPVELKPYFANLTASERMLFPGPPTDFEIGPDTRCVQLDAGIRVTKDGVVLASSDMARTLPLTADARRAYAVLSNVMRSTTIPALRPGAVCEDVHRLTMAELERVREELEACGVMEASVDFVAEYNNRNVGHLMGKQESFANELRPGHTQTLSAGAIGAAEIPWRFDKYSLATEDMWLIGEQETFNLTLRKH
ncbi:M24 family metallopeptidase [Microbacterium sp. USHLN186]|uniref:M24 family metallopeptidase n=1 Tax=Microbacterium sp. USHLN186 TaxID=3081286 RepID=UPI003019D6CC